MTLFISHDNIYDVHYNVQDVHDNMNNRERRKVQEIIISRKFHVLASYLKILIPFFLFFHFLLVPLRFQHATHFLIVHFAFLKQLISVL